MNEIRHIEIYNEKWYLLKDICKILLLTNISDKYKIYYKIDTVGGKQKMLLINLFGIKNIIQNTRSINKNKIIELLILI
jgi:prophage antirepressor-like protein